MISNVTGLKEEKQSMRMEEYVETNHPHFVLVFKKVIKQVNHGIPDSRFMRWEKITKGKRSSRFRNRFANSYVFGEGSKNNSRPLDLSYFNLLVDVTCEDLTSISGESSKNDSKVLDLSSLNLLADAACEEVEKSNTKKKSKKRARDGKGKEKEEEGVRIKPVKKKKRVCSVFTLPVSLANKINDIGGYKVKLVMEKCLTKSDVNKGHSRLSIPKSMMLNLFLTEEEKILLAKSENEKELRWLDVLVLGPNLTEFQLQLKNWSMSPNCIYNLTKKWNLLVKENGLREGEIVQLWSFRVDSVRVGTGLCFGMVNLGKEDKVCSDGSAGGPSSMT